MHSPSYYHNLIHKFLPNELKLVIIAESPPHSGLYFYDESGKTSEPLFKELTNMCLGVAFSTKLCGLTAFRNAGFLLLDATYQQVNKGDQAKRRDQIILQDLPILLKNLKQYNVSYSTPIALIKVNVCKILDESLSNNGYSVVNQGIRVPFPSTGQQGRFREIFPALLQRAGLIKNTTAIK